MKLFLIRSKQEDEVKGNEKKMWKKRKRTDRGKNRERRERRIRRRRQMNIGKE